jgi:cysteine-rich repeat protein
VIDVAHGYAYFGTYFGANSVPATVFEVALGAGSAPPTLVSRVTLGAGTGAENGPDAAERELCTAVVDAGSGFAYFGTDHTYPAKIFQVSLGSGGAAPVETGMLQLVGGTQPVGEPNGPNDGENVINSPSSSYGEVFLQSSVVDPLRGYAYFGTDGYPGMIVKILLPTSAPVGACGDGVVQAGEQCDDGSANGTAGDCCSATCEFVAAGAPCADDGSACTSDVCDGAGACTHPVPAFAGCEDARAGGAVLRMKLGRTAKKDSLVWTWTGALASGDLGDPRGGTGYTLCVMETAADALGLVVDARAPAGGTCAGRPCWSAVAGGYDYRNRAPLAGALARATLRPRAGDRGTLRVVGKGAAIAMPARALGAPVLVRFQRDDAPVCWEATFPTPSRNDARAFRARSS